MGICCPNGTTPRNHHKYPCHLLSPGADVAILPLAVPLNLASTVQLSSDSDCKALVTSRDKKIIKLLYSGADGNLSGRDGVCMPLVRGCLREFKGEQ